MPFIKCTTAEELASFIMLLNIKSNNCAVFLDIVGI